MFEIALNCHNDYEKEFFDKSHSENEVQNRQSVFIEENKISLC